MLTKDTLYVGEEARQKLIAGIRKCALAVGGTMGTGGSNSIIEAIENPGHMVTNDGWTILNSIRLADPIEDMGRRILMEAVSRANKQSGDGSSTTTVLTAAIIEEGLKLGSTNFMEVKRSLEECIPLIEQSINAQKREISVDEVGAVAAISAEDEQVGKRIQEIYQQIGKTGIIHWDISKTPEDYYTVGSGITINDATYFSPYMCDADASGNSTNQIRIKNAHILVTKQKISSASDFNGIGASLNSKEIKDLVVFADEIDPLVLPDIVKTRMVRGFRIAIVKMPVLWKDQWYEDLLLATGAKLIDPVVGTSLKDTTLEHLGSVGNIVIDKQDTHLDGIKDLSAHITALEEDGTDESKVRAARLNLKTARYFVGGHSDSAISYRRLKVEDAISAAYHALNGGVVAGGGSCLASIKTGNEILDRALKAPAKQIALNSGLPDMVIGADYENGKGFDSRTKSFVDMFEAKITDPAVIVLNACKNAISVAASILTAQTIVMLPREEVSHAKNDIMTI